MSFICTKVMIDGVTLNESLKNKSFFLSNDNLSNDHLNC